MAGGKLSLRQKLVRNARVEVERFYVRQLLSQRIANLFPQFTFPFTRTAILRAGGLNLGTDALVLGPITVIGPGDWKELLSIGSKTVITGPLYIDLGAPVKIGSMVRIGHQVMLLTINHQIGPSFLRCGPHSFEPITIGDGSWVASRVTVLPGVTIGEGAVVAAGAVVTSDVPPSTLVGGVPAKVIRKLEPGEWPKPDTAHP